MHSGTWKRHERMAAAMIGSLRKPGSGSQGRSDMTRSDTVDPVFYVECKTRARCVTRTTVNEAKERAKHEGKIAVVVQRETGKQGSIWSIHESDLHAFCREIVRRFPEETNC